MLTFELLAQLGLFDFLRLHFDNLHKSWMEWSSKVLLQGSYYLLLMLCRKVGQFSTWRIGRHGLGLTTIGTN